VYECKDGRHYSVGALEPKFWAELCAAMGRADLLAYHVDESEAAHAALESAFAERTRDEWRSLFGDRDVCAEPVLEVEEVAAHPQNAARGLIETTATGVQVRPAVPPPDEWRRLPPPRLGEHNAEVLAAIGVDAAELERLRAASVI
jgi:crotonobetainyl-CoA:carnitine CoA-transferase CaiB-like acyl-CoA transferase